MNKKKMSHTISYLLAPMLVFLLGPGTIVADQKQPNVVVVAESKDNRDVCDYTSHDWSAMRESLEAISRFKGKTQEDVQQIAQRALAGSLEYSIGEFELQYARGKSGSPPPNDSVCYVKKVTFDAVRNDGNDAAYRCEATMDVKGEVLSITCQLTAG